MSPKRRRPPPCQVRGAETSEVDSSSKPLKIKPATVTTLPLLLGPANTEAATGFSYRWVRDTASRLGVPFVGAGRKRAVRADLFLEALERQVVPIAELSDFPVEASDPAATVRALLGKRKAGAR